MFWGYGQGVDGKENSKTYRQGKNWEGKAGGIEESKDYWWSDSMIIPEAEKILNKYVNE